MMKHLIILLVVAFALPAFGAGWSGFPMSNSVVDHPTFDDLVETYDPFGQVWAATYERYQVTRAEREFVGGWAEYYSDVYTGFSNNVETITNVIGTFTNVFVVTNTYPVTTNLVRYYRTLLVDSRYLSGTDPGDTPSTLFSFWPTNGFLPSGFGYVPGGTVRDLGPFTFGSLNIYPPMDRWAMYWGLDYAIYYQEDDDGREWNAVNGFVMPYEYIEGVSSWDEYFALESVAPAGVTNRPGEFPLWSVPSIFRAGEVGYVVTITTNEFGIYRPNDPLAVLVGRPWYSGKSDASFTRSYLNPNGYQLASIGYVPTNTSWFFQQHGQLGLDGFAVRASPGYVLVTAGVFPELVYNPGTTNMMGTNPLPDVTFDITGFDIEYWVDIDDSTNWQQRAATETVSPSSPTTTLTKQWFRITSITETGGTSVSNAVAPSFDVIWNVPVTIIGRQVSVADPLYFDERQKLLNMQYLTTRSGAPWARTSINPAHVNSLVWQGYGWGDLAVTTNTLGGSPRAYTTVGSVDTLTGAPGPSGNQVTYTLGIETISNWSYRVFSSVKFKFEYHNSGIDPEDVDWSVGYGGTSDNGTETVPADATKIWYVTLSASNQVSKSDAIENATWNPVFVDFEVDTVNVTSFEPWVYSEWVVNAMYSIPHKKVPQTAYTSQKDIYLKCGFDPPGTALERVNTATVAFDPPNSMRLDTYTWNGVVATDTNDFAVWIDPAFSPQPPTPWANGEEGVVKGWQIDGALYLWDWRMSGGFTYH